ncbi:hypothetical protein DFH08DRAFT_805162 [Mycena albidolilacea]|uniref:Uncharacterized protein n=1 Tax=Mycena albidolilacea TaxID=1033008 RepID=A0AAD7AC15_9AGAR|nr:hypothetical protein DFH08DRAFT_805162 [Mycena albidolilacea]
MATGACTAGKQDIVELACRQGCAVLSAKTQYSREKQLQPAVLLNFHLWHTPPLQTFAIPVPVHTPPHLDLLLGRGTTMTPRPPPACETHTTPWSTLVPAHIAVAKDHVDIRHLEKSKNEDCKFFFNLQKRGTTLPHPQCRPACLGWDALMVLQYIWTRLKTTIVGVEKGLHLTCNACLHNHLHVFPEMIGYPCVQACTMLGTKEWVPRDGSYNYIKVFNHIVALFAIPSNPWAKETLKWYQHEVFGHVDIVQCADSDESNNEDHHPLLFVLLILFLEELNDPILNFVRCVQPRALSKVSQFSYQNCGGCGPTHQERGNKAIASALHMDGETLLRVLTTELIEVKVGGDSSTKNGVNSELLPDLEVALMIRVTMIDGLFLNEYYGCAQMGILLDNIAMDTRKPFVALGPLIPMVKHGGVKANHGMVSKNSKKVRSRQEAHEVVGYPEN